MSKGRKETRKKERKGRRKEIQGKSYLKSRAGAGEMALVTLGAAALAEDWSSVSSTHSG